ncbi:hypothetical protein [Natrinema ejinorense]|uniref:Uncharacterized protein n=1 Tax=Natrinema ejinorense TaxID=373386 RepID=A0A2A5QPB5_9EURY|nr:hypothetical protein [Natrinema ejinorense]PCR88691.1 hypothetical protein CP557_21930 [Natrinema ejinorense]
MTHSDPQTRRRFLRASGATLAAAGSAGLATTTASAQTNSQGILADGVGEGGDFMAFIRGRIDGYGLAGAPETAATLADRLRNEFNANSEHWINYGNWLIDEGGVTALGDTVVGVDVAIDWTRWPTRSESVATTIDAGYDTDTDEFTSLEWRLEEATDPDYQATIKNEAAENGADELAEFRREFIDTDGNGNHEIPSSEYVSHHVGKYSSAIELGKEGRSVLELLLGRVEL